MFARVLIVAMLSASLVFAQEDATPAPMLLPPPPAEAQPKTVSAEPPVAKMMPPAPTARERRGGTVGVGYLGLSSMAPLGGSLGGLGGLGGLLITRNQVPLLGVRWWLRNARIGLDAGVGVMMSTGLESVQFASIPSLQLVGHVGLPIAVASTQHVIVLLAPEFRAGFTTSVSGGNNEATGSLLELALRGGIELFFSFIGVPELSLEAAVRVGVAREAQGFSFISPLGPGGGTTSFEVFRFSTSLSGDAASIIASSLSLKYYF
jgi:hypothetical protein